MDEQQPTPAAANIRPTKARFLVLAWLCAAMAVAYVARNAIAVAESTVRKDLGITMDQSGWLMSVFFLSYALFQIPAAQLGQRIGARRALPIFAIAWSVATAITAFVGGLWTFIVARAAQGIAQAGLIPTCTMGVSKWFPKTGRGFATGALGSFMSVGAAFGSWITGLLLEWLRPYTGEGWNWRLVFLVFALPGFLWAVAFWWWFRDEPGEHRAVNEAELKQIQSGREQRANVQEPSTRPATPWLQLTASPALWWICAQQFFRAAAYMFFTSWFATYLQETRKVSVAQSGFLNMWPLLAVVIGGIAGGALSDWLLARTGSRRIARQGMGALCMALAALFTVVAKFIAPPFTAVLVISLGAFFAAMAGPCAFAITIDMGGPQVATVNATMNMMGNFGAWAFPIVAPKLVRHFGSWDSAVLLVAGCCAATALFWLLLKPEGTILEQSLVREKSAE